MVNLSDFTTDELGEIWCNLNCFEWDNRLGKEPEEWNDAVIHGEQISKFNIVTPFMKDIRFMIGEYNVSRSWHLYKLGHTEEEFKNWWFGRG